jgi:hypothetical protein
LNDFNVNSYYLSLNVEFEKKTTPIVIENASLFNIIKNDTLTRKKYSGFIKNILEKNVSLNINSVTTFNNLKKYEVDSCQKKLEIIGKDKSELVNTFFTEAGVQRNDLSDLEKRCLIYNLFKWGIYVKNDDETGYLYIPR